MVKALLGMSCGSPVDWPWCESWDLGRTIHPFASSWFFVQYNFTNIFQIYKAILFKKNTLKSACWTQTFEQEAHGLQCPPKSPCSCVFQKIVEEVFILFLLMIFLCKPLYQDGAMSSLALHTASGFPHIFSCKSLNPLILV